ncbi:phosphatidylinositol-3,4,5-trisphosphate 3-phosphatase and dual-specificity protein phosphatase PTEN [Microdochium nivale]|nr:phosphatidylinositol-3,4,5-trisphosphate 3-phosphatase and dual-specificity protein phosphatase PTEN [Microdochium nivale]
MASLLRQIVAGPRARHPEAGLDLCYVTDNIIATSGPSQTYPQKAYRNPLDRLVAFLDSKHGENWAIWEFRGEGTGYPDDLVYDRIRHYPWPDHHPPPFRLVPLIVASMRNWLAGNDLHGEAASGTATATNPSSQEEADDGEQHRQKKRLADQVINKLKNKDSHRVIVVHCKAGKGRSGTMACSYLIAECGWTPEQALARFTERRMRPKFGAGVSIPSQLRWVGYVDRWTHQGQKKYVDRELEIVEIHVWGLRNGVKVAVEGFIEDGRKIRAFHTYKKAERTIVEGDPPGGGGVVDMVYGYAGYSGPSSAEREEVTEDARTGNDNAGKTAISHDADGSGTPQSADGASRMDEISRKASKLIRRRSKTRDSSRAKDDPDLRGQTSPVVDSAADSPPTNTSTPPGVSASASDEAEPGGKAVIFKSERPVRIPTSEVNITLEKRSRAPASMGLTMVTAVAHVWFNAFFEGNGPEKGGVPDTEGVFEIEWDKMDGIKGSWQKGARAADRIAVVWRSVVPKTTAATAATTSANDNLRYDANPALANDATGGGQVVIDNPKVGDPVPQMQPADWKGANDENPDQERKLGLRVQSPDSAGVSQASSIREAAIGEITRAQEQEDLEGGTMGVRSDVTDDDNDDFDAKGKDGRDASAPTSIGTSTTEAAEAADMSEQDKLRAYAQKLPSPDGRQ